MGTISEDNINISEFITLSKITKQRTLRRVKYIVNFAFQNSQNKNVLLVGCGIGIFLNCLNIILRSNLLIGVDIDYEALNYANKQNNDNNIHFIQNSEISLPFKPNSFDFVISDTSLHHYREPLKMILEMERVTKNEGKIIISDINSKCYLARLFSLYYFLKKMLGISNKFDFALYNSIRNSYTLYEVKLFLDKNNFTYKIGRNGICFIVLINKGNEKK